MRKKILAGLITAAALAALSVPVAASAGVSASAGSAGAAISVMHRVGTGPWIVWEANGVYAVGAANLDAGTAVVTADTGRYVTFDSISGSSYYLQFINGNYMASNDACSGITIKSSSASDGVVWIYGHMSGGNPNDNYLENRYCTTGAAAEVLSGAGTVSTQYNTCLIVSCPSGTYQAVALTSP
jgi:hypothetical protein